MIFIYTLDARQFESAPSVFFPCRNTSLLRNLYQVNPIEHSTKLLEHPVHRTILPMIVCVFDFFVQTEFMQQKLGSVCDKSEFVTGNKD